MIGIILIVVGHVQDIQWVFWLGVGIQSFVILLRATKEIIREVDKSNESSP